MRRKNITSKFSGAPGWIALILVLGGTAAASVSIFNGSINATAGFISGNAANSVAGSGYTGPAVIAQATAEPTMQPGHPYTQAVIVQDGIDGGIWNTCYNCALGRDGYTNSHWHLLWMNYPGDAHGNSDIALGGAALGSGDAGKFGHNLALGVGALEDAGGAIPGQNNVAIGFVTMRYADTTAAQSNVSVGNSSGVCISTGQENTFLGTGAGTGTCSGAGQGPYSYNTAIGYNSGVDFASARYNSFVGFQSGDNCSSCTYNVGSGALALGSVTTQSDNTAVGYNANGAGTGTGNTVIGSGAGKNISGDDNVVVGENAAAGSASSVAAQNVYIGGVAGGSAIAGGSQNVVIGYGSALSFKTAANNTVLGAGDSDITSGANNVELGDGANVASPSGKYQLSIMNAIYGASNTGFGSAASAGCIAFYSKTCAKGTVYSAVTLRVASGACTGGVEVGTVFIYSSRGAPTCKAPNGSLYMRSDGTTGSRMYVSAGGGTWTAVPNV